VGHLRPLRPATVTDPLVWTQAEAAERLKVSIKTVQRLTSSGELRATYIGRLPRYTERDLEACVALLSRRRRRVA
jgi:excisionase family DNA binding protein